MKVQFLGAAQTVTGSCYMVEAAGARFTVDCGMHQGNKAIEMRNFDTSIYRPANIDFILMTHAHIDHSGLLPRMVREGFKNPVYCTEPTRDFLNIMLLDSAHIQETEARFRAEKYRRRGKKKGPPVLYTTQDAEKTLPLLHTVEYKESFEPHPGIRVTYYDAGHILGSAFIHVEAQEQDITTSVIFSGDLGRPNALIVRDPEPSFTADYIFMESTYGDRNHNTTVSATDELAEAIQYSHSRGEKVIIPAFAVERTQELLYCLHELAGQGKIPHDMPIYVDSPLAIRATQVFSQHTDLFDENAQKLLSKGENPFALPNLHFSMRVEESRALNEASGSAIILSASGMCNAGRIRHHLRHNLWKKGASIVFVGYQGVGTPGRRIVEKAQSISLFGDDVPVAARIFTIGGFSAHAGQSQLLDWLKPSMTADADTTPRIILTHGEEKAQAVLAKLIEDTYGATVLVPEYLEELELTQGRELVRAVNEAAYPRVDWDFLTQDMESKLRILKEKLPKVHERPWLEQAELRDRVESFTYELTKLISRM